MIHSLPFSHLKSELQLAEPKTYLELGRLAHTTS